MKNISVIYDEICSVNFGALNRSKEIGPFVGTSDEYYMTCVDAFELEEKGLFRRAMTVWLKAFDLDTDSPHCQQYAVAGRARCFKKLKPSHGNSTDYESGGGAEFSLSTDLSSEFDLSGEFDLEMEE